MIYEELQRENDHLSRKVERLEKYIRDQEDEFKRRHVMMECQMEALIGELSMIELMKPKILVVTDPVVIKPADRRLKFP
jgi:hypothetical protein